MIQPAFEILNQRGTPMFFSDVFANRPTAGIVGRIFISTDTAAIYRDTGTTWNLIADGGSSSVNIYNSNGTLTGNRVVSLNGNYLSFDGGQTYIGSQTASTGLLTINNSSSDAHLQVVGANSPSIRIDNAGTGATRRFVMGLATATNNFIQGSTAGDICISTASASPLLFGMWQTINASEVMRISTANNLIVGSSVDNGSKFQVTGSVTISSSLTTNSISITGGSSTQLLASNGSSIVAGTGITISGGIISSTGGGGITGSGVSGQIGVWDGTSSQTGYTALTYNNTGSIGLLISPSLTAASGISTIFRANSSLTASANSDVLVGLDINPTFTNGAFTSVANAGIRIGGQLFIGLGKSSLATNIIIGSSTSGRSITSGALNTIIGNGSGAAITSGGGNTAVGGTSLASVTTSNNNTAIGQSAMQSNTGSGNNAVGQQALLSGSGSSNCAFGTATMNQLTTGAQNTAIGNNSLGTLTSTSFNIGLGVSSGRFATATGSATNNSTSVGCVFLGYDTRPLLNGDSNEIVISGYTGSGDGQVGLGTNTITIGNSSSTFGRIFGNLLLGTSTNSGQRLYVNGSIRIDGQTAATAGGSAGLHLILNLDGTNYKIALLNV